MLMALPDPPVCSNLRVCACASSETHPVADVGDDEFALGCVKVRRLPKVLTRPSRSPRGSSGELVVRAQLSIDPSWIVAIAVLLSACARQDTRRCQKDTDCKGERVCSAG